MSTSTTTLQVRQARPEDLPHLVRFQMALAKESEDRHLDEAVLTQGIQAALEDPQKARYWVLLPQSENSWPMGMCMLTWEWSDWHNRFYGWLQGVYIHPDHRGQGHLERLIAAVEEGCRAKGIQELRLYVDDENPRAIRAYQKLGFAQGQYQVMQKAIPS